MRVDIARIAAKPATLIGVIADSAPPQIIASASPRWMILKLSPMAWAPAEQAVAVAEFGPFAPVRIETHALEQKHRAGYQRTPVARGEFSGWETEHAWGDE